MKTKRKVAKKAAVKRSAAKARPAKAKPVRAGGASADEREVHYTDLRKVMLANVLKRLR
ncbi:MAG: hypothetical protein ACREI8_09145 [Myxococcota bacterium]|jgi:hypothetical protein